MIFVLTLTAGRLLAPELFTIQQVLNSIELPGGEILGENKYTVIFNKVKQKFLDGQRFQESGKFEIENHFNTSSSSLDYVTNHIYYIPFDDALDEEDDAQFSNTAALAKSR